MTNKIIKSKWLRSLYARELFAARRMKKVLTDSEWCNLRFGIETGFWAVQKAMLWDSGIHFDLIHILSKHGIRASGREDAVKEMRKLLDEFYQAQLIEAK